MDGDTHNHLNVVFILSHHEAKGMEKNLYFHTKVTDNLVLEDVVRSILKKIHLSETKISLQLYKDMSTYVPLKINESFKQNNLQNEDNILIYTSNYHSHHPKDNIDSEMEYISDDDDEDDIINVIITTRIVDSNGQTYPKVNVKINSSHKCKRLFEDISTLWDNKSNLKFKYGRLVLSADKTFTDYNIENESEIIVTGGRN